MDGGKPYLPLNNLNLTKQVSQCLKEPIWFNHSYTIIVNFLSCMGQTLNSHLVHCFNIFTSYVDNIFMLQIDNILGVYMHVINLFYYGMCTVHMWSLYM